MIRRFLCAMVLSVVLGAVPGFGQPGSHGPMGPDKGADQGAVFQVFVPCFALLDELNITNEQFAQLRALHQKNRERHQILRKDLRETQGKIKKAFADGIEAKDAMALAETFGRLTQQSLALRLEIMGELRGILNAEQMKKLFERGAKNAKKLKSKRAGPPSWMDFFGMRNRMKGKPGPNFMPPPPPMPMPDMGH
jgi:Spy/CpxP family protein refolding chaperone